MSESPDDVFVVDASFAQQSMWLLHQMDPGKPTYNVTAGARIKGLLDTDALGKALNDVVARHETLRTVFRLQAGAPVQVILPALRVPLPVIPVHPSQIDASVRREAETPLDIESGPLLRMCLLRLAPDDHVLVLSMHHIIFDGWSSAIMFRELSACYQSYVTGRPADLPALPIQYADYAVWQRETLAGERLERLLGYWTDRLAGADSLILPADRPRPAVRSSLGAKLEFMFPAELMKAAEELGRERRATLFMVLLAALGALFSRYSGQTDITISTAVANRGRPEIAGLIGYFVNTLVLRTDLSGNPSVDELIARAGNTCREAYNHQEIPFDKIVEAVQPTRDGGVGNALVRAMLVLQNMETEPWESGGLVFEPMRLHTRTVLLDLSMTFEPDPAGHGYACLVEYSTDLFNRVTIEHFVGAYQQMLEAFVADPRTRLDQIALSGDGDWTRTLEAWNASSMDLPDTPVHELIARQAARTPGAVAVEQGESRLTYEELQRHCDAVATALRSCPVSEGTAEPIAAVVMDSSPGLVAAILAVLASGWAFVPLDPRLPRARIGEILDDCAAAAVLTSKAVEAALTGAFGQRPVIFPDQESPPASSLGLPEASSPPASSPGPPAVHAPAGIRPRPGPEGLACVFYTSGSTGKPKGVMMTHRALSNFAQGVVHDFAMSPEDRYFQLSSIGFDVLLEEIFPALIVGAAVVIPAQPILAAGGDLAAHVARQRVTVVDLTPAYWHEWTRELDSRGGPPDTLRLVVVGGDRVLPECVQTWRRFGVDLVEGYGLTEATVITTSCHLNQTAPASGPSAVIGRPTPNTGLHVLDRSLRPVPPGGIGEIYISGAGLARGYLGRSAETASRFVADPGGPPGARMCRTGDLAKRRADGEVEFIGRADHQIKLRGHRVEPAEVEAVIAAYPHVTEAVVLAREDHAGKRLVAYVTAAPGSELDASAVRAFAAEHLPEVLVPAAVVILRSLPLTGTGKIDRAALADMDLTWLPASRKPATADEELLCQLLGEVLGVPDIGAEDDFFSMGGDSITAIQLAARARESGLAISPRDVFTRRTVARLAVVAGEARPEEPGREGAASTGPMPLTPAASRLVEVGGNLAGYARAMVVRIPGGLTTDRLARAVQQLLDHHDALRMKIAADAGGTWRQEIVPPGAVLATDLFSRVDVAGADDRRLAEVIAEQAPAARRSLNAGAAVMARLVWLDAGDQAGRLLVVLHHLVADDESWRMLMADLVTACGAPATATTPTPARLEPPVTSLREWARGLETAATEPSRAGEFRYWRDSGSLPEPLLGSRRLDLARDVAGRAGSLSYTIGPDLTGPLLSTIPVTYRVGADDILLTGLVLAVIRWRETHGRPSSVVKVMLEGDGREERTVAGADLSRTVGAFTSPLPVSLNPGPVAWADVLAARPAVSAALRRVKDQLRAVPGTGLGYGLLRYLNAETGPILASQPQPQLRFRYLSQLGAAAETPAAGPVETPAAETAAAETDGDASAGVWTTDRALTAVASTTEPDLPLAHAVEVEVLARDLPEGPSLSLSWVWAAEVLSERDIRELAEHWQRALEALARHSQDPTAGMLTPSDVPLVVVTQDEIETMEQELRSGRGTSA